MEGVVRRVSGLWGTFIVQRGDEDFAVFWPLKVQNSIKVGDAVQWREAGAPRVTVVNLRTRRPFRVEARSYKCSKERAQALLEGRLQPPEGPLATRPKIPR
jgi:hypothetical protein